MLITPDVQAYNDAVTQLIALHQAHFDRLLYSAKVRFGLLIARGEDESAAERRRVYGL